MKVLISITLFIFYSVACPAQSLSQRLGYSPESKLLILHADDLGVAHSENQASFDAFRKGMVNSGSIMVPCPWFNEVAIWASEHPEADLGLHLTLTAEWKHLKWGPLTPVDEVPGLVNKKGHFYDNVADVVAHATAEEVEKELRAQIDKALAFGLQPTHLDTHMGSILNEKFFPVYIKLGQEYKIPVMVSHTLLTMMPLLKPLVTKETLLVDHLLMANPQNFETGMAEFYSNQLKSLSPGVSVLLMHLAYDNAEMQAVTIDHPDYGAQWRQHDFNFFTSEACRKILEEENIQLITWREIGALLK